MKRCTKCQIEKPLEDFYRDRHSKDGRGYRCKLCKNQSTKKWRRSNRDSWNALQRASYARNPETRRGLRLRDFGITLEQYNEILITQGGVCAICKQINPNGNWLSVDHDHSCCPDRKHSCGRCVRGLLCNKCNLAEGLLAGDLQRIEALFLYVKKYKKQNK